MNRVELVGGLTKAVDARFINEYPMSAFTLAVNGTRWSSEDRTQIVTTTYVSCQAWGHQAKRLMDDDPKVGERLYILGELDQSSWEDKDGKRQQKTRVRVTYYVRLDPRGGETEDVGDKDAAPY